MQCFAIPEVESPVSLKVNTTTVGSPVLRASYHTPSQESVPLQPPFLSLGLKQSEKTKQMKSKTKNPTQTKSQNQIQPTKQKPKSRGSPLLPAKGGRYHTRKSSLQTSAMQVTALLLEYLCHCTAHPVWVSSPWSCVSLQPERTDPGVLLTSLA